MYPFTRASYCCSLFSHYYIAIHLISGFKLSRYCNPNQHFTWTKFIDSDRESSNFGPCKSGVPLTDYKRVGGSAVGGSIGWNLLRLFSTDRFDPIARPSDQISHWQSKITSDRRTKVWHGRLPLITSDYYFSPTQVLPLPDFSSGPPILRSVGQWDVGLNGVLHVLQLSCFFS